MAPFAAASAAIGKPFHVGEGNSVSCGQAGVSDVLASALWAVDTLFEFAAIGTSRWNFHGMPRGSYSALVYEDISKDDVQVQPLFYGLLAFQTAAAKGAAMLKVSTVHSTNALIKCHAVVDAAGSVRVVVIHKDPEATTSATISVIPATPLSGSANGTRLLPGPQGILSRWSDGISFGGLTWGQTTDGSPAGTPAHESVAVGADGAFTLSLPPSSIVILTLPYS
jgi:hypothetical protein